MLYYLHDYVIFYSFSNFHVGGRKGCLFINYETQYSLFPKNVCGRLPVTHILYLGNLNNSFIGKVVDKFK